MAPLQRTKAMCQPCDIGIQNGPHGNQYFDLVGERNIIGGRPDERHGEVGSFTHGVCVWAGGIPHDVRPSKEACNPGTVLFVSSTLKPDLRGEQTIKPGTEDERQGRSGSQAHWAHPAHDDLTPELNHGKVLATFPHLRADLSREGRTNVAGGRPDERLGAVGSFSPGIRVFTGGAPRDVAPCAELTNHGIVLFRSATLRPDVSCAPQLKPGTCDERQGRCGSFEHGDAHLRMPTRAEAELWKEAGQAPGGRRWAPGHFLAGTSVWGGGVPQYAAAS